MIGYEDALQGQSLDRIGLHRKACADHGVTPNLQSYKHGYAEGLSGFCTSRNGYNKGLTGYTYNGICQGEMEHQFLSGYDAGRDIYLVTSELNSAKREIETINRKLDSLESQITSQEKKLFSTSASQIKRRELYENIQDLKSELESMELKREQLYDKKYQLQDHLIFLQNTYHNYNSQY